MKINNLPENRSKSSMGRGEHAQDLAANFADSGNNPDGETIANDCKLGTEVEMKDHGAALSVLAKQAPFVSLTPNRRRVRLAAD
jgi:hypothetical protein